MKIFKFIFSLAIVVVFFGFSDPGAAADSASPQDAYDAFRQTAMRIERELYAKQAELASLMANDKGSDPRVQELFKEMGELRGQLFAARVELDGKVGESENGFGPRPGGFYRGGPGFGCCAGGFGGRGWGPRHMYR